MTIKWKVGKKPTQKEIESVISNALPHFGLCSDDRILIAKAIIKFYDDRIEGKR